MYTEHHKLRYARCVRAPLSAPPASARTFPSAGAAGAVGAARVVAGRDVAAAPPLSARARAGTVCMPRRSTGEAVV